MLSQTIKKQHINDLVDWIEANLTNDINIDQITLKSGYSKWHMQRLFKEMTGQTLAAYTRKRRLTLAAMALRLTRMPLIDVAVRFGFENQQNFNRVFKNHFMMTPGAFRRHRVLPVRHFHGRIAQRAPVKQAVLVIREEALQLQGETLEWECRYGDYISDRHHRVAEQVRQVVRARHGAAQGWLGFQYGPGNGSVEQQHISLFRGLEAQQTADAHSALPVRTIAPGLYASLAWSGSPDQLTRFIADIYYLHLPKLGVACPPGMDLLCLDLARSTQDRIEGVFFIPVTQG
ncbi:AraC family transcriptional regulator [Pantoea ananatis]|uniref:helix-turn-helix domain-containing protein n=1 Tax=Pantoea ananas TaxID=553 RepID=UPI000B5FC809|nr:helix-turn-helix domain-containing protein [Pantoea ananatis]ASN13964.1 AraC family transcriptional regulator [Pantoea ananatis]